MFSTEALGLHHYYLEGNPAEGMHAPGYGSFYAEEMHAPAYGYYYPDEYGPDPDWMYSL